MERSEVRSLFFGTKEKQILRFAQDDSRKCVKLTDHERRRELALSAAGTARAGI